MARLSAVYCLQDLKEYIEKEIASGIKLLKEKHNSDMPDEYVNPYVGLVTLPHKNFMPVNFQVPHILIGLVSGHNEPSKENTISVRLQCAVYGGDVQFKEDMNLPDETGYISLINLQERIIEKLTQAAVIGNCVIDQSFDWGIYDEDLTYPYWYGYIQFSIDIPTTNRQKPRDFLDDLLNF